MRWHNLLLITVLSNTLFASSSIENILSNDRQELIELNKQQAKENNDKLSKDWINPITYKYIRSYSDTYDTVRSMITVNQPIFKSGGIYQAIKYADALYSYQNLDIEVAQKNLIKEATSLLFQIHKTQYTIQKQELLVKNAQIDIERKKEQVFNGLIDTSFLDNAILDANIKKNALLDLEYQKQNLINNFNNLSSKQYTQFDLPRFDIMTKDQFMDQNIELKKSSADIETKDWLRFMTVSKYLPTVNVTYDYTKYHDDGGSPSITDDSFDTYGVNVTIPLDIRTFDDIESQKIEYLKSRKNLEIARVEQENFLNTRLAKLQILDKKVKIAQEDVATYDSLLTQMNELFEAGLKTQSDVDTMKNSLDIKYLDIRILDIEAQLELLELYAKI